MKIAIRYQSRGGNTKAVAEAMAKTAGVKAEPLNIPIDEPVDILFVGGGVYAWTIDKSLQSYLENLDKTTVKSIAAFSTGGGMSGTHKIASIAKSKGINVCEKTLPVKFGLRNHASLGGKGYINLNDKQIRLIDDFFKEIIN